MDKDIKLAIKSTFSNLFWNHRYLEIIYLRNITVILNKTFNYKLAIYYCYYILASLYSRFWSVLIHSKFSLSSWNVYKLWL